jgi:hypothetical protein
MKPDPPRAALHTILWVVFVASLFLAFYRQWEMRQSVAWPQKSER